MSLTGNSESLFLSYASADRDRALAIAGALDAEGLAVWIDQQQIAGGTAWAAGIAGAIRDCRTLLVLCTPASMHSRNVRQELQLAWDFDKSIIPLVDDVQDFPQEIAYFLHGRQWILLGDDGDQRWVNEIRQAVGVEPSPARVQERLKPDGRPAIGIRLPEPPGPLIGRTSQLEEIVRLLGSDSVRLVTLTGPGGVGKTRLALEAAQLLVRQGFPSAVFIDFSTLTDPDLVPATIASAIGLLQHTGNTLPEGMSDFIGTRSVLLLLDNMEHLLESATLVAEVLRASPGITLLVTSREPLRVRGEHEMPVRPLPLPDTSDSPGQVLENEAVALFASRAMEVRPDFELSVANSAEVAEICRRLDGLPLAIELASARARLLSTSALLKRLENRLGLLTDGPRDAPNRQQTLRDTIAWSYDLLSLEEQMIFIRLSVFAGGFPIDAAAAIAGSSEADALNLLSSLQEKSLLQLQTQTDGEPRFRMLETIRDFSLERLRKAGLEQEARQLHFDYCVRLSEWLGRGPAERTDPGWYADTVERWDLELDNFRAAWQWRQELGDSIGVLTLTGGNARYFWNVRPYGQEVLSVIEQGLESGRELPLDLKASGEIAAASLAAWIGQLDLGFEYARRGLATATAANNRAAMGHARTILGALWEVAGECEKSAIEHGEAVAILREVPGHVLYGIALGELGDRMLSCGKDVDAAIALIDQAIEQDRKVGYSFGLAVALGQRAHAARLQGDLGTARRLFGESVEVASRLNDERRVLGAFFGLAAIAFDEGNPEQAARIIGATEYAVATRGRARVIAHPIHNRRIAADVRNRLGDERYDALTTEGRWIPYDQLLADALSAVADHV